MTISKNRRYGHAEQITKNEAGRMGLHKLPIYLNSSVHDAITKLRGLPGDSQTLDSILYECITAALDSEDVTSDPWKPL